MTASLSQVPPGDLRDRLNTDGRTPLLLDVRTPVEYREVHLDASLLVPLDRLNASALARREGATREVVVICRSGKRATAAAEKLTAAGMEHVEILEGGLQAWEAAGLPVRRGQKGISLERQVRIAAGLLVLAGVILGTFIHSAFYALSGLIGAGLIFAGVTDWCGMGMLLARAPWNRSTASDSTPVISINH